MKTIKTKLFYIFMVLMISLVLGGIILNSVFLESYYIYKNKGVLVSVSQKIKDEYMDGEKDNYQYADTIQSVDNINTIIVDNNYDIKYNSIHPKSNDEEKRLSKEIKQTIIENEKRLSKKYVYYIDEKNNDQRTKLVFVSQIENGDFIILKKSFKEYS